MEKDVVLDEDYKVSSELYEEHDYGSSSKPSYDKSNTVSKFIFKLPPLPRADLDGDLIVKRKSQEHVEGEIVETIEIEHSKSTVLDLVGLQIWRGALLLTDWLLHEARKFQTNSHIILELGSGVGLTSIVASMVAPVLCTDVDKGGLLQLIRSNISRNKHLIKHPVQVLELDFTAPELAPEIVDQLVSKTPIVIAADVIYDDLITDAFVETIEKILAVKKCDIYVALEKRYVFTIADCDSVAPCYEYFMECLDKVKNIRAEQISTDFPQYFEYERVKELVFWKITSVHN